MVCLRLKDRKEILNQKAFGRAPQYQGFWWLFNEGGVERARVGKRRAPRARSGHIEQLRLRRNHGTQRFIRSVSARADAGSPAPRRPLPKVRGWCIRRVSRFPLISCLLLTKVGPRGNMSLFTYVARKTENYVSHLRFVHEKARVAPSVGSAFPPAPSQIMLKSSSAVG
jgi:hypothetical protein